MTAEVKTELVAGILTVTLARPDKKNALTNEMYGAIADAIEGASAGNVRVILVQGEGDSFTAGNDLGEFAAQAAGSGPAKRHVERLIHALANTNVPVVAAVQGKAVGVGTTMLLHCDYVLLSEDAQLITPFVNLALVPEAASTYLLPLRIGHARAFEMFAFGAPVSATNALAWGIANRVVPNAELRSEARRIAEMIAAKPSGSVTAMKQLMRDVARLVSQIDAERAIFSQRLQSAEAREAFAAFAEKRTPKFH
ncbi:enoyl-CoA hydratase/isomerase family protein [Cupriavidus necator]|uniref:Enoyl-CoA hydratase n=1 Tax=Cupriavidus necator TaxID=106590 RepID=A0A367PG39_CUPNE|nr:enoyl-CoA hydratase-related protein [Cupriavidus necator]QQX86637.1 enoyl-CoA hydratase/isomerase family protein [Cupriavidus necator]RCJ06832.1 enoyl-CoA hydratase [Cupriavidus necator]